MQVLQLKRKQTHLPLTNRGGSINMQSWEDKLGNSTIGRQVDLAVIQEDLTVKQILATQEGYK
jgi:hypothetical protein